MKFKYKIGDQTDRGTIASRYYWEWKNKNLGDLQGNYYLMKNGRSYNEKLVKKNDYVPKILVLYGGTSSGKTFLAKNIAKRCFQNHISLYANLDNLTQHVAKEDELVILESATNFDYQAFYDKYVKGLFIGKKYTETKIFVNPFFIITTQERPNLPEDKFTLINCCYLSSYYEISGHQSIIDRILYLVEVKHLKEFFGFIEPAKKINTKEEFKK